MSERIVHIGLGAFFRAHQAWYTQHSDTDGDWKIVAYTGRSAEAAEQLKAQNCQYTLIVRGAESDQLETISAISRAVPGTDLADLMHTLSKPEIALVTLTITEAAYLVDVSAPPEKTALGRLALALENRRRAQAAPIALVPCDNIPENGKVLRIALENLGQQIGKDFLSYLVDKVSFVSTSIDRITPKTTAAEVEMLSSRGIKDSNPVVTEPFSDWVLSGDFPAGRPQWELAGAKFVSNITPFENRKLWLLNGSHTLLALLGSIRGHETVAQAISDPICRAQVIDWWDTAEKYLTDSELKIPEYREALMSRYENPRIEHLLSQIANDSSLKLALRMAPVAIQEISQGNVPSSVVTAVASWIIKWQAQERLVDGNTEKIKLALNGANPVQQLIEVVSKELSQSSEFIDAVNISVAELSNQSVLAK